jgi:hypothetical protein
VDAMSRRVFVTSAIAGLVGAGLIVATMRLTTRGPAIYIPYAAMLLSLLIYFRMAPQFSFKQRFSVAFLAFMTATTVAYVYVISFVNPNDLNVSRWSIAKPLAAFALIGCISSSIVAIAARSPLSRR